MEISPGDRILVKNVKERGGTGKLKSFWEQTIYEVVSNQENLPVYKIKPVRSNKVRIIHRNLIKLCNELPGIVVKKPIGGSLEKKKIAIIDGEDEDEDEGMVEVCQSNSDDDETRIETGRMVEMGSNLGMRSIVIGERHGCLCFACFLIAHVSINLGSGGNGW